MKRMMTTAALAALGFGFSLPAGAQDYSQLAASAGISVDAAQGMTLTEIAAVKFNRDSDQDDAQTVSADRDPVAVDVTRHAQLIAAADMTPEQARGLTLAELAVGKYNTEVKSDDRQVYMSTRGAATAIPAQFIAAAGLSADEARGMSLNEIYVLKINRESGRDERQAGQF